MPMKSHHKVLCVIIVLVIVVVGYHMVVQHQGQSLLPAGLGSK